MPRQRILSCAELREKARLKKEDTLLCCITHSDIFDAEVRKAVNSLKLKSEEDLDKYMPDIVNAWSSLSANPRAHNLRASFITGCTRLAAWLDSDVGLLQRVFGRSGGNTGNESSVCPGFWYRIAHMVATTSQDHAAKYTEELVDALRDARVEPKGDAGLAVTRLETGEDGTTAQYVEFGPGTLTQLQRVKPIREYLQFQRRAVLYDLALNGNFDDVQTYAKIIKEPPRLLYACICQGRFRAHDNFQPIKAALSLQSDPVALKTIGLEVVPVCKLPVPYAADLAAGLRLNARARMPLDWDNGNDNNDDHDGPQAKKAKKTGNRIIKTTVTVQDGVVTVRRK
eukprot:m.155494 g.155494  ORF g.155494 m.155494 type:complete len:341 (+) comp16419_c0_seq1:96-1118(+)